MQHTMCHIPWESSDQELSNGMHNSNWAKIDLSVILVSTMNNSGGLILTSNNSDVLMNKTPNSETVQFLSLQT